LKDCRNKVAICQNLIHGHINSGILRKMTVVHIIPMRNIDVNDWI